MRISQQRRQEPKRMPRVLYSILFTLLTPFVLIRLLVRSIKAPGYRLRIAERFALQRRPAKRDFSKPLLWIHAVSVGETVAAAPLVHELRRDYPDHQILITCMTPTGSERVKALFGDTVLHAYLPYDTAWAMKRFVKKYEPAVLILMETELWPNLIHYCGRANVPVVLANARLSARSARGYSRFGALTRPMLQQLELVAAQSQDDAHRLICAGANPDDVRVTGSLKFIVDVDKSAQLPAGVFDAIDASDRVVIIASSTREGEEEKVLTAFKQVLERHPQTVLLLVPRHPERFDAVATLVDRMGLKLGRRSKNDLLTAEMNVYLGDSMGEMVSYYRLASIAFVGGSLVNTGCQNVLEPAAFGIPVVTGPSQFNFATICRQLEAEAALRTVADEKELADFLIDLIPDWARQAEMGRRGKALVEDNQDSLPALLSLLEPLLVAR
jgi:3-deoxy-D-manno-octulosonic-acid transferase